MSLQLNQEKEQSRLRLEDITTALRQGLGDKLVAVVLFGSRARGDADEESDLDLFVALKWDDPRKEIDKLAFNIACDLTLESGILVSVFDSSH